MYKEYSWNVSGFCKGDANKIGKELETIEQAKELTAENVVDYARTHTGSELYNSLEWDDSIAGDLWRKKQASFIITNIRVKIINDDETPKTEKPVRAYVQTTTYHQYEPIEVVTKDFDKYQALLNKAYKELGRTKTKYSELSEIQELLKDIPEVD